MGLRTQDAVRRYVRLKEPIYLPSDQGVVAAILPADDFQISYTLSYGGEDIQDQYISFQITPDVFLREIGAARDSLYNSILQWRLRERRPHVSNTIEESPFLLQKKKFEKAFLR